MGDPRINQTAATRAVRRLRRARKLLREAQQALEGIVALDDEDAGPNGESLTCSSTARKIGAFLEEARI